MSFCVRSIRIFSKFSCDPYYEPLSWFMIYIYIGESGIWLSKILVNDIYFAKFVRILHYTVILEFYLPILFDLYLSFLHYLTFYSYTLLNAMPIHKINSKYRVLCTETGKQQDTFSKLLSL